MGLHYKTVLWYRLSFKESVPITISPFDGLSMLMYANSDRFPMFTLKAVVLIAVPFSVVLLGAPIDTTLGVPCFDLKGTFDTCRPVVFTAEALCRDDLRATFCLTSHTKTCIQTDY